MSSISTTRTGDADTMNGSNGAIHITGAQAIVNRGDDSNIFAGGADDSVMLENTGTAWGKITGTGTLRERVWWGAGSNATAIWAAKRGMNLQSSTLKDDETGEPFHVQQAAQTRAYRAAWKDAGHTRTLRVSVSRSIFVLADDRDRAYFSKGHGERDTIGFIDEKTRAIFGRSYAGEPEALVKELAKDEAIAEADTLLLTVPNQLGVAYNAHVIEGILTHIAPAQGWR